MDLLLFIFVSLSLFFQLLVRNLDCLATDRRRNTAPKSSHNRGGDSASAEEFNNDRNHKWLENIETITGRTTERLKLATTTTVSGKMHAAAPTPTKATAKKRRFLNSTAAAAAATSKKAYYEEWRFMEKSSATNSTDEPLAWTSTETTTLTPDKYEEERRLAVKVIAEKHAEANREELKFVSKMSSHHNHYKDSTSDLKHDLKRKRRELEEMEERLKREETESKRLKGENADLWKLYYGLQQELQTAYERNAKLTVEKMNVEGNYEKERHEHERLKQEVSNNVNNAATLKDALCSMQSEKLALQQKFNDLVVENKKLKDREREIEPKLREVDEMKKKMDEWQKNFDESQNKLILQRSELKEAASRKEKLEAFKELNDKLREECEQKNQLLKKWPDLVSALDFMDRRTSDLETQLKAKKTEASVLRLKVDSLESGRSSMHENLQTLASKCRMLNDEAKSAKNSLQREVESIKIEPWFKSTDICESLGKIIVDLIKNAVTKKNSKFPSSSAHFSSTANQNDAGNLEKTQNSSSSPSSSSPPPPPPGGFSLLFNDSTFSAVTVDETVGNYDDDDDVQIIAASTSLPPDDDDDEQQITFVTSSNENDDYDNNNIINNEITIIDFVDGGDENNTTLNESEKKSESNENTQESLDAIGDVDSTSKYVLQPSDDQKLINKNDNDDDDKQIDSNSNEI